MFSATLRPALWVLAAALPLPGLAQVPDSASTYKHQLGLTASPQLDGFFKNNRTLPLGLLYKRQVKPQQALRLGLSFNQRYDQRYDPVPAVNGAYTLRFFSATANAGWEWQRQVSRRWLGFAGVDAVLGYTRQHDKQDLRRYVPINGVEEYLADRSFLMRRSYSAGLRPLLGVRFQVLPFLYASAEAALPLTYAHVRQKAELTTTRTQTGELVAESNGRFRENLFQVRLRPVNQVTLHYCFGKTN